MLREADIIPASTGLFLAATGAEGYVSTLLQYYKEFAPLLRQDTTLNLSAES